MVSGPGLRTAAAAQTQSAQSVLSARCVLRLLAAWAPCGMCAKLFTLIARRQHTLNHYLCEAAAVMKPAHNYNASPVNAPVFAGDFTFCYRKPFAQSLLAYVDAVMMPLLPPSTRPLLSRLLANTLSLHVHAPGFPCTMAT